MLDKREFRHDSSAQMPDHTLTGNIHQHTHFRSAILGNERDIWVYLPRGYRRNRREHYPVFYMHDGQNLFDAATAFNGVEWGVDETAQRLIREGLMQPTIIVAVANTGLHRIDEYAPTQGRSGPRRRRRSKGLLRKYGRFLAEELKPFIDKIYRTQPAAEFTGLGGSSLGGLATMALGLWFPHVFTRLAVMSPSVWWDQCVICEMVEAIEEGARPPLKIWLDTGTFEHEWELARGLRDRLVEKGWRRYDDLHYQEFEGADHSEAAWAGRIGDVLRYLYPPLRPSVEQITSAAVMARGRAVPA